jgi:hypothetical protein
MVMKTENQMDQRREVAAADLLHVVAAFALASPMAVGRIGVLKAADDIPFSVILSKLHSPYQLHW